MKKNWVFHISKWCTSMPGFLLPVTVGRGGRLFRIIRQLMSEMSRAISSRKFSDARNRILEYFQEKLHKNTYFARLLMFEAGLLGIKLLWGIIFYVFNKHKAKF